MKEWSECVKLDTFIAAGHPARLPQVADLSTDEERKYTHLSVT